MYCKDEQQSNYTPDMKMSFKTQLSFFVVEGFVFADDDKLV